MKKVILILLFLCVVIGNGYAAPVRSVTNVRDTSNTYDIEVDSTALVFTKVLNIKDAINDQDVGVLYRATSDGTVDLRLEAQTSYTPPATEGASDTNYFDTHVIDTSITDEVWHLATVDTVILPYMRFKITGQGSNDSSTTIEIKVTK